MNGIKWTLITVVTPWFLLSCEKSTEVMPPDVDKFLGLSMTGVLIMFVLAILAALAWWRLSSTRKNYGTLPMNKAGTVGEMQTCKRCETTNPGFARFCHGCGESVQQQYRLGAISIVGSGTYFLLALGQPASLYDRQVELMLLALIPVIIAFLTRFDTRTLDGRLGLTSVLIVFLTTLFLNWSHFLTLYFR